MDGMGAVPLAIVCGFVLLYLAITPAAFLPNWELFLIDLFGGLIFGAAVFLVFDRVSIP